MTYVEIGTDVQDTIARTDTAVTARTGIWINRRQRMAAARHNFGFLRTEVSVAITAITPQSYSIGGTFKDEVLFYLDKSDAFVELPVRARLEMIRHYSSADKGEPQFISYETWNTASPPSMNIFIWPPKADKAYTLKVVFYRWPTDLSANGDTNWITDHFPQVLIAGAVAEAYWFLGAEEQALLWERRWEEHLARAIEHDVKRDMPAEFILTPRLDVGERSARVTDRDLWRL